MLIASYNPRSFALVELIDNFRRFTRVFPGVSWTDPVEDSQLIEQGVPARRVAEVARPALEYGQAASATAERQGDGSWLQVWTVTTEPIDDLKAQATSAANDMGRDKISTLELARGLAKDPPEVRPRTQSVLDKVDDIKARIDAATTGAEIKVILDELGGF